MLAKRVIPCMDVKDGRVVKGVNFVNLRDAGDPIELAQRYDEERAAAAFGSQAILCAIDAKHVAGAGDKWEVYVYGGRKATGIDAVEWAQEAARRGAGEILLTSMDRDGSRDGFDCALTRAVARAVDIPVIASGGVGKLEHFAQGVIEGEADAVLAASVFHFGELTVRQVKEHMRAQGIPVRL